MLKGLSCTILIFFVSACAATLPIPKPDEYVQLETATVAPGNSEKPSSIIIQYQSDTDITDQKDLVLVQSIEGKGTLRSNPDRVKILQIANFGSFQYVIPLLYLNANQINTVITAPNKKTSSQVYLGKCVGEMPPCFSHQRISTILEIPVIEGSDDVFVSASPIPDKKAAVVNPKETNLTLFDALKNGKAETAKHMILGGADIHIKDNRGWTPLTYALRFDQAENAKLLINRGANLNEKNKDGWTPLMFILRFGTPDNARLLIDKGADINVQDPDGWTPLTVALRNSKPESARLLIDMGADVNVQDPNGWTPLLQALRYAQPENARLLIDKGADVNVQNSDGWTPLMVAIRNSQPENARLLIDKGVDVNVQNTDGWTSLMVALRYSQPESARLLIDKGADINVQNTDGWTALMFAAKYAKSENVQLLIKKKATINVSDDSGWTPLMLALRNSQPENARLLIDKGADVNVQNTDGWTPLMVALRYAQPENARLLIDKGADVNVQNSDGWTPLMVALRNSQPENARLLIDAGADVNVQNTNGWTPLMFAAKYARPENVQLLIKKKATINVSDNLGLTPLMLAIKNEQYKSAQLLFNYGASSTVENKDGETALMIAQNMKNNNLVKLFETKKDKQIRSRKDHVTPLRLWRCPKCEMVLKKSLLGQAWKSGDPISKVNGTGTCSKCGSKYPQADIYGGKYDILLKAKIAKGDKSPSSISMVVFQKNRIASASAAYQICENIKNQFYSSVELNRYYVIVHKDTLSLDEAYIIYRSHLDDKALPDLGQQFDAKHVKTTVGENAATLFFVKDQKVPDGCKPCENKPISKSSCPKPAIPTVVKGFTKEGNSTGVFISTCHACMAPGTVCYK